MVDTDVTQQIAQAKSQSELAKQQITQYQQTIPTSTSQKLLRAIGFSSPQQALQQRVKITQAQATSEKALQDIQDYQQQVNQYEQDYQNYLKSDAGKLQYVKEMNLSPSGTSTRFIPDPHNSEGGYSVQVNEYETPFGKVQDLGKFYEQAQATGQLSPYINVQAGQSSVPQMDFSQVQKDVTSSAPIIPSQSVKDMPTYQSNQNINQASNNVNFATGEAIFPLVSASDMNVSPKSSYKDLSSYKVMTGDGLGLPNRTIFGSNLPMVSRQSPNPSDSSVFSRILSGFKSVVSPTPQENVSLGNFTAFKQVSALPYQTRGTESASTNLGFTPANIKQAPTFVSFASENIPKFVSNIPYYGGEAVAKGLTALGVPSTETLKPVTFSLPYQTRGTSYYDIGKGFYSPTITTKEQVVPSSIIGAGRIAGQLGVYGLASLNPVTDVILMGSTAYEGGKEFFNPESTPQERLSGGLALAGTGAYYGLRGINYLRTPVVKEAGALRPLVNPTNIELSGSIVNSKGEVVPVTLGYKIKGEITPPTKVYQPQSRLESWFFSPEFTVKPSRGFEVFNVAPIVGEEPYLATTIKQGSRIGKLSMVSGEKLPFDIESFGKLPKTQQYPFLKLAEEKSGVPVSPKNIKDVLGSGEFSNQLVRSEDFFKLNTKTKTLELIPSGKRTSLNIVSTQMKPLYETEELKVFTGKSGYKEVTNPLARATGKSPQLKNVIVQIKQPLADFSLLGERGVPSFQGGARKSSDQFLKSLYETPKPVSKPSLPNPVSSYSLTPSISPVRTNPLASLVVKSTPSVYTGTGQYEKTSGGMFPLVSAKGNLAPISLGKTDSALSVSPNQIIDLGQVQEPTNISKNIDKSFQINIPVSKDEVSPKDLGRLGQVQEVSLTPINKQTPESKQVSKTILTPIETPRPREPIRPKRPTGFPLLLPSSKRKLNISRERLGIRRPVSYDVGITRRGKIVRVIPVSADIGSARAIAGLELKKSIKASAVLLPKAGTPRITGLTLRSPEEFRSYKISKGQRQYNPLIIIQKSSSRLGTRAETKEIQMFRKGKGRFKI